MKNLTKTQLNHGIEINDQFSKALDLMESSRSNVFITGRAGTGKSTLLEHFKNTTKKNIAVLAPTGVAAVNVQGQTIHSFFGFRTDVTPDTVRRLNATENEIYKKVDAIVIDEISMVRADLLDCIDRFLRINRDKRKPFGGAQMIFIGDLYQLPPVVTGKEREIFRKQYKSQYFFDSKAFETIDMDFIELEKIYRQKDGKFISLLNSVRNNSISDEGIIEINKRLDPKFSPKPGDFYIHLTTTNDLSREINEIELSKLKGKKFQFTGKLKGSFDRGSLPTDIDLNLKVGSQIMLVNNDSAGRWVNGTVGKVTSIMDNEEPEIIAEIPGGKEVEISPYTWKMYRLVYNRGLGSLESESVGSFTQYPLRLAWSVTIHKAQGKTFDNAIIDIGKGTFSHGQLYVALSRCTSLNGMVLKKPIHKKHIFMDWKVVNFLTKYQYKLSDKNMPAEEKIKTIKKAIKNKSKLEITYLKSNDMKSKRTIQPKKVGDMEYMGKEYVGLEAYCLKRQDDRVFRVDRILEIKEVL